MNILPVAKPDGIIASSIHYKFREKLLFSLQSLIKSLIQKNKYDIEDLQKLFADLELEAPFNSKLYVWHWELLEGMRNSDPKSVRTSLENLKSIVKSTPFSTGFVVNTISDSAEHQLIRAKLEEHPVPDKEGRLTKMDPIGKNALKAYRKDFTESINLIQQADPEMFAEVSEYVREIVLTKGSGVNGASSIQFFGTIFLREPNVGFHNEMYFLEHLVHETSHHHLFSFQSCDPILNNPEEMLYASPLRRDPRPMLGVIHGEFVLSRMIYIFRRCLENGAPEVFRERLQMLEKKFEKGRSVIKENAQFTDFGKELFISMEKLVA